jgi:murein DD-endopeptidase MepM/ murein hydrolase activator NlpD
VRSGDPIARTGRSGRVTGPHLHMEMLFNGERIDPQRRLP